MDGGVKRPQTTSALVERPLQSLFVRVVFQDMGAKDAFCGPLGSETILLCVGIAVLVI